MSEAAPTQPRTGPVLAKDLPEGWMDVPRLGPIPGPRPGKRHWGLGDWWIGLAIAAVGTVAVLFAVFGFIVYKMFADPNFDPTAYAEGLLTNLPVTVASFAVLWLGFGLAPVIASRKGGKSLRDDMGLRFKKVDILLGLGVAALIQAAQLLISWVFSGSGVLNDASNTEVLTEASSTVAFLVIGLCTAIGAPFFEELYFRGLLLRSLLKRKSDHKYRGVFAVAVTTIVFGLAHGLGTTSIGWGSLILILLTGTMGLLFTLLAYKTQRLGGSMIAHALVNGSTVILIALGLTS